MLRPNGLADVRKRAAFMRSFLPYALLCLVLNAEAYFATASGAAGQDNKHTVMHSGCHPSNLRIVIDIGHTPEAAGALSARGIYEYEFNLRLATQVRNALVAAGFTSTYLMRMRGANRTLEQRADRANRMGAELFVSIHHDSVQDKYLRTWKYKGHSYQYSDRFKGYSVFVSYANAHVEESRRFAVDLAAELKRQGLSFTTHHAEKIEGENRRLIEPDLGVYRYDELVVLKRSNAPAVLLEAGVIVNREEELVMATPEFRERVAQSVLAATI
jgi:N-acetylmuramoyl-L-alanine amidase